MRFRLIDAAKKEFPVSVSARFLASVRAAILPGRIDRPAVDSMRTWCCKPIFARPLHAVGPQHKGGPRNDARGFAIDGITVDGSSGRPADGRECPEGAARGGASNERPTACNAFPTNRANLLNQDFNAAGPHEPEMGCRHLLCLEGTPGWLYLAVVIDHSLPGARRRLGRRRPAP